MKALLYCVKSKPYLSREMIDKPFIEVEFCLNARQDINHNRVLNGKIVAEVEIDKVEEIKLDRLDLLEEICKKSCLSHSELYEYLADFHIESNCMFYKKGYALHITNFIVFDKPKELTDYLMTSKKNKNWIGHKYTRLNKTPQNMCNVYDNQENHYVLISIKPQHLCKILNGEKTIEVRRKVLNCLKGCKE